MSWLNLDYDSIYFQSKRLDLYKDAANTLIKNGKAYFADGAVFLNVIDNLPNYWIDTIGGNIKITDNDLDNIKDMVLIKSDGSPTYNFCSIIDDLDMNINWIIRGVDHINNTAKQIAILIALGKSDKIRFTHVGLIHGLNGKKISKSDGAKSIIDYKNDGYNSQAILNFILRLGWSPKDPNFDSKYKIIGKDLAIKLILNDGNFQASKSKFDQNKLNFYNKIYNKIKK